MEKRNVELTQGELKELNTYVAELRVENGGGPEVCGVRVTRALVRWALKHAPRKEILALVAEDPRGVGRSAVPELTPAQSSAVSFYMRRLGVTRLSHEQVVDACKMAKVEPPIYNVMKAKRTL